MRWLRRGLVALLLVAPVLVVTAVAWPDDEAGGGGGGDLRREGSGPDGEAVAGDRIAGELGFGEVARYTVLGSGGELRIGASGAGFDFTLTVVDDDGDQIAFNDDSNGLDPEVTFSLDEGETARVEVRELSDRGAAFTMSVDGVGRDGGVTTTAAG